MKEYSKIIKDLEANANIEGGFIVSRDGLLIYTDVKNLHAETFAAMTATLLSSAEVAMDELGGGIPKRVIIEGKGKNIIIVGAGRDNLLAVITSEEVEKVYEEVEKASKKISLLKGET